VKNSQSFGGSDLETEFALTATLTASPDNHQQPVTDNRNQWSAKIPASATLSNQR
jgi:hypothetical protein